MSKPVSRYSRNSNQFLQLLGVRSSAVEEGRDLNIGSFHSVGHVKNVPKMVIRVMNERLYLAKKCVHRWVLYIFFKMQIPPLSFRYNIEIFFGFTAVHKSRCIFAATGIFLINVKFYSSSHLRNPINTLQILAQEKKGCSSIMLPETCAVAIVYDRIMVFGTELCPEVKSLFGRAQCCHILLTSPQDQKNQEDKDH